MAQTHLLHFEQYLHKIYNNQSKFYKTHTLQLKNARSQDF